MESSEMKRDKEWLKNETEIMGSETSENYPHEQMVDREEVLNLIDQLDEPVKVVVPRFVADWYESNKDDLELEIYATAVSIREKSYDKYTVFEKWFNANNGNKPFETIIKMKLYGYDTEKEIKDHDERFWPFAVEVAE